MSDHSARATKNTKRVTKLMSAEVNRRAPFVPNQTTGLGSMSMQAECCTSMRLNASQAYDYTVDGRVSMRLGH